jgi:hypothetical protein
MKAGKGVGKRKLRGADGQLVSVAEIRLSDFDGDPEMKLLMRLNFMRADKNSLGFLSANAT